MEFKIKCTNCGTFLEVNENNKIGDYLCRYLLNDDNDIWQKRILRCDNIACPKCKICWACKRDTGKFHKLLE